MPTTTELQQYVDRIWAHTFQTDMTDTLMDHLRMQALVGVRRALETALVEELTQYLGTAPYERAASDHPPSAGARSG